MPNIPTDHPRPASFGTESKDSACAPLTGWIDEPRHVRLLLSPDGSGGHAGMPVLVFVGSGKRIEIGFDASLPGGSRALKLLREAVDEAEHYERLRAELELAAGDVR